MIFQFKVTLVYDGHSLLCMGHPINAPDVTLLGGGTLVVGGRLIQLESGCYPLPHLLTLSHEAFTTP